VEEEQQFLWASAQIVVPAPMILSKALHGRIVATAMAFKNLN
jgi:hypothetical protein